MLRAVGISLRQVRRLIRYESVITALIGAVLGLILGCIFAALISQPLKDQGFELTFPVGQLVVLLVLAALPGCWRLSARRGGRRGWACWRRWRTSSRGSELLRLAFAHSSNKHGFAESMHFSTRFGTLVTLSRPPGTYGPAGR